MGVKYSNNAETTLSSGINNSTTSISVASSSSFPAITGSDYFYATIDDATNLEIVKVTAVSGTTWTVVRAQDDTTARAFSSGDTVELRINTAMLTDVVNDARTSTFVKQAFTGDGSTTDYTLSQTPGSENDLIVFIEGVFQTQSAYSLSGAVLSFSAAPANTREIVVYHLTDAVSGDSMYHNSYTGNGSTTAYTLSIDPIHENNLIVFLDGVYQNRSTYSVSGTTLTLDAAPANGVAIEVTIHTQTEINVPATNSVGTAQLQDNSVTSAKIAADVIVAEDLAANSITVAELSKTALSGQTGVTAASNDYVLIGDASDSDNLKKALVSSITATTSSVSALTASGVVTANAGVVVDELTIDADTITATDDFIIDAAGDITLDAADNQIFFKDAGTTVGTVTMTDSNFKIISNVNDKDMIFAGTDNSSEVVALTLDMSDAGKATFNNGIVSNAGVVVDNITIDGTEIDLSSGDLLVDVAGDIYLDAAGAEIHFSASGGTGSTVGYLSMAANNLTLKSGVSDKDIIFQGNDGGSTITALTLDMSDAGTAIFNNKLFLGDTASHTDDLLQIETPASGGGHGIQLRRNDSNTDQQVGRILFGNNTDTDLVQIHAKTDGANDNGALIFSTQPDGGSLTERMRITHDGDVNIPVDSAKLQLGAGNDLQLYHDGSNSHIVNEFGAFYIDQGKQDGNLILRCDDMSGGLHDYFYLDGGSGSIKGKAIRDIEWTSTATNSTAGHHIFKSYNTEIMRIDGANNRVGIGVAQQTLY